VTSTLVEHALAPGTFAVELSGDLTAWWSGAASLNRRENGAITFELHGPTERDVILVSSSTGVLSTRVYRVWGDDCESSSPLSLDGETVFSINAQGGVEQPWTLSASHGSLFIDALDTDSVVGRIDARTCAERAGSDTELQVVLRGAFHARRAGDR
jgi:hypothetical protein